MHPGPQVAGFLLSTAAVQTAACAWPHRALPWAEHKTEGTGIPDSWWVLAPRGWAGGASVPGLPCAAPMLMGPRAGRTQGSIGFCAPEPNPSEVPKPLCAYLSLLLKKDPCIFTKKKRRRKKNQSRERRGRQCLEGLVPWVGTRAPVGGYAMNPTRCRSRKRGPWSLFLHLQKEMLLSRFHPTPQGSGRTNERPRPRGDDLTQVCSQYLEEIDSVSLHSGCFGCPLVILC